MPKVTVLDHPLIKHKLTLLRMKQTDLTITRKLMNELTYLMAYESTRGLPVMETEIETPLARTKAKVLAEELVVVPILRAGLGMLDGFLDLIPTARVGFIGLYREHDTLEPVDYYCKVPTLEGRKVMVLDPMLATGGSAVRAIATLKEKGASDINYVCVMASPEGLENLKGAHPDVDIFCASIDERLDENGYILPGMGDCGDRLFGTK